MDSTEVFGMVLGLEGTPWKVDRIELDAQAWRLDLELKFEAGSRFAHPQSGQEAPLVRLLAHRNSRVRVPARVGPAPGS